MLLSPEQNSQYLFKRKQVLVLLKQEYRHFQPIATGATKARMSEKNINSWEGFYPCQIKNMEKTYELFNEIVWCHLWRLPAKHQIIRVP
jgi:hypothetical protein